MLKGFYIFRYPATIVYIISVVLINTLFLWIPFISIFGTTMTPADITAGSVYVFRDFAQREIKHYVLLAMIIASVLSYFLANHAIAVASFSAFITAEFIDWSIFTFTKKPLSKRLLLSAVISAPIDTWIFLHMLGMLHWLDFLAMTTAKLFGVFIVLYIWKLRRESQNLECLT
jgi:queuosine precursor transporter